MCHEKYKHHKHCCKKEMKTKGYSDLEFKSGYPMEPTAIMEFDNKYAIRVELDKSNNLRGMDIMFDYRHTGLSRNIFEVFPQLARQREDLRNKVDIMVITEAMRLIQELPEGSAHMFDKE